MKKLAIFILAVSIDQLFKYFALKSLLPSAGDFFIPISCNKGIAFSIEINFILFILAWIISIYLILHLAKHGNWSVWLVLILAGAISNAIDRITAGCVIDFIQFPFWKTFPSFNIADIFITVGAFSYFFFSYSKEKILPSKNI